MTEKTCWNHSEPEPIVQCSVCHKSLPCECLQPKQQTLEAWCEHMNEIIGKVPFIELGNCNLNRDPWKPEEIKFCPVCGTPRPVKKSLAEKFEKILWQKQVKYTDYGLGPQQPLQFQLAEIAQQHFGVKDE